MERWTIVQYKTAEERAKHIDYISNNADRIKGSWFWYDINYNKFLFLYGLTRRGRKTALFRGATHVKEIFFLYSNIYFSDFKE